MTLIARRWQADRGGGSGLGVSGSDNNGNGKAQHNQLMAPKDPTMQQVFLMFVEIHNNQAHMTIHNLPCSLSSTTPKSRKSALFGISKWSQNLDSDEQNAKPKFEIFFLSNFTSFFF